MLDTFKKQAHVLVDFMAGINRKISYGQGLEAVARMNEHKSWNHAVASQPSAQSAVVHVTAARDDTQAAAAKPDNPLFPAVNASGYTDNRVYDVDFDAVAWFAQASDEAIFDLYNIDWGGNYASDAVLSFFEKLNPEIKALFEYLERLNDVDMGGDTVGFECRVNTEEALTWLKMHRPWLFRRILRHKANGVDVPGITEDLSSEQIAFYDNLEDEWLGSEIRDRVAAALASPAARAIESYARHASRMTVLEVCMTDLFEYGVPEGLPEWSWVEKNGSFPHRDNGKAGVWEFMVHIHHAYDEGKEVGGVPERLRPLFAEAHRIGAPWVMFHQG